MVRRVPGASAMTERVHSKRLRSRIMDAAEAVERFVPDRGSIAFSCMGGSSLAKEVPEALGRAASSGRTFDVTLLTGGATTARFEAALPSIGIRRRFPDLSGPARKAVNDGSVEFFDTRIGEVPESIRRGHYTGGRPIDVAVIEATAIDERGHIIPSLSVDALPALAGRVMEKELTMLGRAVQSQDRPKIAIFGGVKADDSIAVSKHMLEKGIVDKVLTTGGVANMFLQAGGFDPGTPTTDFMKKEVEEYETYVAQCKELLTTFRDRILMPMDVVVNDGGKRKPLSVQDLPSNLPVQDIGLDTIARYIEEIEAAKTIFFNGPAGVFEKEEFSIGTRELLSALAESDAFTVAGGGHTVAAIEQCGLQCELDHVSTGGGALINFLAGKELPLVAALERSYKKFSAKKE